VIAALVFVSHFHRDTAFVVLLVAIAKAVETLSDLIYGFWLKQERFDKIAIALFGRVQWIGTGGQKIDNMLHCDEHLEGADRISVDASPAH
jgi:hypothetical protein